MNDTGDGLTKVRAHRQAYSAVTKYKVLDSSCGCSLVELQPLTGKSFILLGMLLTKKKKVLFFLKHSHHLFVHHVYRSEAPNESSYGIWADVPHSGWPQILQLEQTGTPGHARHLNTIFNSNIKGF